ncbi:SEC-C metal-binding domain-containing protein [Halalkalibacter urbisdiaboli]
MANAIKDVKVTLERNQPCFCGAGKKFKKCHLKHK